MCLAVPVRIEAVEDGDTGVFEIEGARNTVNLALLDDVKVGDYVLLHAGFAIQKIDEMEAKKTLKLFREIANAAGDA
ncbi:MAG: HypC/HybG/HupF family hydrogenase formation chaperone [bacterium]